MHPKPLRLLAKVEKLEEWNLSEEDCQAQLGLQVSKLTDLEKKFQGRLVWRGEPGYDKARREYDPQYNEHPIVVAFCETIDDIALCLAAAKTQNWPIACRSGGHSTAGYSVVTDGIVIDTSEIDYVIVDPDNRTARVGVGVDFQTLNNQLTSSGLHVPGGECLDVHVGGYFQGGGYGFTSRQYGMNCDNVLSARLLVYTEDGIRMVTANANHNKDLFWAICGGTGNNFGVVIDVTYRCHQVEKMWGFMLEWDNIDDIPQALFELQNGFTISGAPNNFGSQGLLFIPNKKANGTPNNKELGLILSGIYNGPESEGRAILEPLLNIGNPKLTAYTNNYAWLNAHIFPDPHLPDGVNSFPPEIKDSRYIAKPISLGEWKSIVEHINYSWPRDPSIWPSGGNVTNAIFFEYYGGAINSLPKNTNAFVHRNVYMDIYLDSFYYTTDNIEQRKAAISWLDGVVDKIEETGCTNGHSYQNYPRRGNNNYRWAYWGAAFWTLLPIKQKFDPFNLFDFPQGIKPPESDNDLVCQNIPEDKRVSIFPNSPISYDESYIEYLEREYHGN